jgi:hypothetical protein
MKSKKMSARKLKKRTKFGLALAGTAKEILAHANGVKTLAIRRVLLPDEMDVMRIREDVRKSEGSAEGA